MDLIVVRIHYIHDNGKVLVKYIKRINHITSKVKKSIIFVQKYIHEHFLNFLIRLVSF
jgi:hypothetical protein